VGRDGARDVGPRLCGPTEPGTKGALGESDGAVPDPAAKGQLAGLQLPYGQPADRRCLLSGQEPVLDRRGFGLDHGGGEPREGQRLQPGEFADEPRQRLAWSFGDRALKCQGPSHRSEPRRLSRRPGYVSVASSTEAEW